MQYGNSNPGPSGDMESLYSEEEPSSSSSESSKPDEKEKDVEDHTELVSKKLLGGKEVKEGDEIVVQVVKDYGDEVEVRYAPAKPDNKEPHGMSEDEELSMLAKAE